MSVRELSLVDFRSNYQAKNSSFSTVAMTIYLYIYILYYISLTLSVLDIYYNVLF